MDIEKATLSAAPGMGFQFYDYRSGGQPAANRNGQPFGGAFAAEGFTFIAYDFLLLSPSHNWQGWECPLSNLARILFYRLAKQKEMCKLLC